MTGLQTFPYELVHIDGSDCQQRQVLAFNEVELLDAPVLFLRAQDIQVVVEKPQRVLPKEAVHSGEGRQDPLLLDPQIFF